MDKTLFGLEYLQLKNLTAEELNDYVAVNVINSVREVADDVPPSILEEVLAKALPIVAQHFNDNFTEAKFYGPLRHIFDTEEKFRMWVSLDHLHLTTMTAAAQQTKLMCQQMVMREFIKELEKLIGGDPIREATGMGPIKVRRFEGPAAEGYFAYMKGIDLNKNPYDEKTDFTKYRQWRSGYHAALYGVEHPEGE